MMVSKLAEHAIALSLKEGKTIRLFTLNRILFFAIGFVIRRGNTEEVQYIKDRYRNDFERWRYGAVAPMVYYKYNGNGARRITKPSLYHKELAFFDDILSKLMDVDGDELARFNIQLAFHKMWVDRVNNGKTTPNWTYEEIEYEFKKLKGKYNEEMVRG